jgi:glycosyltransferase involved in cell wall biosynthesis
MDILTNTKNPLVSIITPSFNRADFLEQTIISVLEQDYPNIEYIVLDDGSTDNTTEILKKYEGQIEWKRHENMGEQRTVNLGFKMTKGDYVCVVNSDDPLYPGAIQKLVQALQENIDAIAAYPDWNEIDSLSNVTRTIKLPIYDIREMLVSLDVSIGPGLLIRRKSIKQIEIRDTSLKYAGDLALYFQLALIGRLIHIPEPLATHRIHANAASTTGKGKEMADQLVKVIFNSLSHPNLPSDLWRQRFKIYYRIHYHAAKNYCGKDIRAKIKHYFLSFFWRFPDFFVRKFLDEL